MPRWMRNYLESRTLRFHFWVAMGVGLLLRALSAYFVYGPQALDDYKHAVWPAYQLFAGQAVDLPEYRSYLLVWLLSLFVKVASWADFTSALAQVRAMYFGLAVISLVGIYGTYRFVRTWPSRLFGSLAIYLAAAFPLMPFVSTRAFGEAVAMSLVMLAFGLLESARHDGANSKVRTWIFGFMALGLACLFRFHVGLIYVVYMAILFILQEGKGFVGALVAGSLAVIGQATVDAFSGKMPLSTLFIYLRENEGGAAKYGVSPWYNPLLFLLALSLAPFSFLMFRSIKGFWQRAWPMLVPVGLFVLAHCLVAHKEERFLYPIIGIELWMLAYMWADNAANVWVKRIFTPVFFLVMAIVLPVVCFVNTQEGEIEPPALIGSEYESVVYLDHKSLFGQSRFLFYLLRPPSLLEPVEKQDFNANKVDQILDQYKKHKAVVLLTSEPEAQAQLKAMSGVRTMFAKCHNVEASGSLVDRLLYKLNPKHNQRRRPTWYLVCARVW